MNATVEGSIVVDGRPRSACKNFKRIASFVPQEDSLMGVLTVRETLSFAAALQGPKNTTIKEQVGVV